MMKNSLLVLTPVVCKLSFRAVIFILFVSQLTCAHYIEEEQYQQVDSEYVDSLRAAQKVFSQYPPLSDESVKKGRSVSFALNKRADVKVELVNISAVDNLPSVKVYVINADKRLSRPAILHTHGGGFVLGSAESSISLLQLMAKELDCTIVSVEYSLAPEATYKISVEENYAALRWLYRNAALVGVDPNKIALLGESAGGGHAALLAITARDRAEVPVLFQSLIYPMLDDRTASSVPVKDKAYYFWKPAQNVYGWKSFLGQQPGTDLVPESAVPARTKSLAGLPPAFIAVGSLDLFVNEDIDYAQRLVSDGVPTELIVIPGVYHGFDVFQPEGELSRRFHAAQIAAFKKVFAQQPKK
jgi:acetyl esterase/lipase